jgi:hypothetical protein
MAEDVNWLVLLIAAPVLALLTTIPIHPHFMNFSTMSGGLSIKIFDVARMSVYNFYAPYGKNRFLYPIFTWIHWFTVCLALGLIPIWIFVRLGFYINTSTALRWLVITSLIVSVPSPCCLSPSWQQRKQGFEKELQHRLHKNRFLPTIKNRYD